MCPVCMSWHLVTQQGQLRQHWARLRSSLRLVTWHIAAADVGLFPTGLAGDGPGSDWDGHTTAEKYERLARLGPQSERVAVLESVIRDALGMADGRPTFDAIAFVLRSADVAP